MDFFGHMKDIAYYDYSRFIEKVDLCRHEMLAADAGLLHDRGIDINVDETFELTDGRMAIEHNQVKFDCFYHYKPRPKLYVFLNGALTQAKPQFSRWSYYKFLDGSVLNIADPMYYLYEGLRLGWYYGDKSCNLRVYIAEIVRKIAEKIAVKNENIIFYGSSGGGAAVIECASHIEGSKAVSINPQVVLSEYFYAEEFERLTHNSIAVDNQWNRNNGIYYLQHNNGSKHLLLVNIRCESDMRQVENICRAMEITVKYGFNFFGNLMIWLYDCYCEPYVNAHDIQDNFFIFFAIEKIWESIDNHKNLGDLDSFCRYINEWWYTWWKRESYWRSRQPDLKWCMKCANLSRTIVLFGTGSDAHRLCSELLDIPGENYYGVKAVIDNDRKKSGTMFRGMIVLHPDEIQQWTDYFIIIATSRYMVDIQRQLEEYGLIRETDFIALQDLYQ